MSREIKFRAWEKQLKEMIKVEGIKYNSKRIIINPDGAWRTIEEVELMQYTGLKDKNHIEIYEDDIVKTSGNIGSLSNVIKFVEGAFIVDGPANMRPNIGDLLNDENVSVEIVGNIYENPELLK